MGIMTKVNGGGAGLWASVLSKAAATSTCEAEVNAAVVATRDAFHIFTPCEALAVLLATNLFKLPLAMQHASFKLRLV